MELFHLYIVAAAFINMVFAWLGDVVGIWLGAGLEHKAWVPFPALPLSKMSAEQKAK